MSPAALLRRLGAVLPFLPLWRALWWARLGALRPARLRVPTPWGRGVCILIPESGTPDLLGVTLQHAVAALAEIDEPGEIVVLVNGAPAGDYDALQQQFPAVHWHFEPRALGFNGAVEAGLTWVRQPAVYLLNSDMRLAPAALRHLLPLRMPQVFALASQIFFPPAAPRREETGWSDYYTQGGRSYTYEREPPPTRLARGTLYASGGSSLFQTRLLREYVRDSRAYSPFYWEDADWGVRAWAEGLECLFVPDSHAVHEHRGTIKRRYALEEIERIVDRNGLLFELRQHLSWLDGLRALIHLSGRPPATRRELASAEVARGIARVRRQSMARQREGFRFDTLRYRYVARGFDPRKPVVLWVTPFAVLPPAHGGARRIVELARRLAEHVNLVLLSDEQVSYDERVADFGVFAAVHLVQGRRDRHGHTTRDLPTRLQEHAPPPLRRQLVELQRQYGVALVQVEFMEAARLVEERLAGIPFVASLHDVYLDGGSGDAAQRELLQRYSSVIACSAEDAASLGELAHCLVPNGATDRFDAASASPAEGPILFMGPFRYQPNFDGLVAFLEACWPAIRAACPSATLTVLAGREALQARFRHPALQQPGVTVISDFIDPAPALEGCVFTLNPQRDIRGSALKVAESLLARRVCLCTREGARGFGSLQGEALLVADDWPALTQAAITLLQDVGQRRRREASAALDRRTLSWDGQAALLLAEYRRLLPGFFDQQGDA
jgi:GT2 family glycosyltransferase